MKKPILTALLLSCVLALGACQSVPAPCQPVQVALASLPPLDPKLMQKREANFLQRLLNMLSDSDAMPTKP